jgi:hypothetical protein
MIIGEEVVMSRSTPAQWRSRSAAGALAGLLVALVFLFPARTLPLANAGDERQSVAYLFLSSNTDEQLSLSQAVARLDSPVQAHFRGVVGAILDQLDVGRYRVLDGVGDWSDGVENSILVTFTPPADEATLRYAAAWFGLLADQKSVLAFVADPAGPDAVLAFDLPLRDVQVLRLVLDRHGIPCRTLLPQVNGCRVIVFDEGRRFGAVLHRLGAWHDAAIRSTAGKGFLVGETTRLEARERYQREIRCYEDRARRRLNSGQLPLLVHHVR